MMSDRASSGLRGAPAPVAELHLVCCGARAGHLVILARRAGQSDLEIPHASLVAGGDPDAVAARAARELLGRSPGWMAQAGTFATDARTPLGITIALALPATDDAPAGWEWVRVARGGGLSADGGSASVRAVESAVRVLRERMDIDPIAFHMLPRIFTLAELQRLYELLLGRKLHKASFRRSLHAAELVQPVDEWRSEGRGRPAQFFRYAPKRLRGRLERSVRFELLR